MHNNQLIAIGVLACVVVLAAVWAVFNSKSTETTIERVTPGPVVEKEVKVEVPGPTETKTITHTITLPPKEVVKEVPVIIEVSNTATDTAKQPVEVKEPVRDLNNCLTDDDIYDVFDRYNCVKAFWKERADARGTGRCFFNNTQGRGLVEFTYSGWTSPSTHPADSIASEDPFRADEHLQRCIKLNY